MGRLDINKVSTGKTLRWWAHKLGYTPMSPSNPLTQRSFVGNDRYSYVNRPTVIRMNGTNFRQQGAPPPRKAGIPEMYSFLDVGKLHANAAPWNKWYQAIPKSMLVAAAIKWMNAIPCMDSSFVEAAKRRFAILTGQVIWSDVQVVGLSTEFQRSPKKDILQRMPNKQKGKNRKKKPIDSKMSLTL